MLNQKMNLSKTIIIFFAVIGIVYSGLNSTDSLNSSSMQVESTEATDNLQIITVSEDWTWSEFGEAAVTGGVAGAVAGGVACLFGTPTAAVAAGVGGVAGVAGGAAAYAVGQLYSAVNGNSSSYQAGLLYSDSALD